MRVPDDPRIALYEQERAAAIEIAHKAMATSYIGAPPANLRGDADRMVAALLKAGWTPPGETVVEEDWDPVSGRHFRRRVIVVEDWSEKHQGNDNAGGAPR
jgi:hypothetical protein